MIAGVEVGSRRAFACALEWPGWCRSGRTSAEALERLSSYRSRYGSVLEEALLAVPEEEPFQVLEKIVGDATTDVGAPGGRYAWDLQQVAEGELSSAARVLEAAYRLFDETAARAPEVLRKGPRGGGRDRDAIVRHVREADIAYGRKLGIGSIRLDSATPAVLAGHRRAIIDTFATAADGSPVTERGWPLRYAARRGIWHVLDHLWEIEDRSHPA